MLRELYLGKVNPSERRNRGCEEYIKHLTKIEVEERYFMEIMSLDDCARFQKLSDLHLQLSLFEEGDIFSYGFTMGAFPMMDMHNEALSMKIN